MPSTESFLKGWPVLRFGKFLRTEVLLLSQTHLHLVSFMLGSEAGRAADLGEKNRKRSSIAWVHPRLLAPCCSLASSLLNSQLLCSAPRPCR